MNTDGGHLAGVVRDAITAQGIDADVITEVLRPHAHRYGVKLGDGTGLVARFLEEAGIPKATRQAVDLLTTRQAVDLLTKNAAGLMNVSAEARAELIEQLVQKMAPNVAEVTELIAAQWAPFTKELIQSIIRQVPPTDGALREAITKALLTAPPSATTAAG